MHNTRGVVCMGFERKRISVAVDLGLATMFHAGNSPCMC